MNFQKKLPMSRIVLEETDIQSEDDGENSSDYTLINRGSPAASEVASPSGSISADAITRNSPRSGSFKCSQCFQNIEVGRPIYMRNDFPYCSKDCRELGVSSIYRVLFGSSLDNDAGFVTRLLRQMGGSSASLSSMEDNDEDDEGIRRGTDHGVAMAARARARSFLKSVVGSVSRTSLGSSFIRTYSSSVLWGKDMTRNTSFNMLFSYLPELRENQAGSDPSITQVASQSSSGGMMSPPSSSR